MEDREEENRIEITKGGIVKIAKVHVGLAKVIKEFLQEVYRDVEKEVGDEKTTTFLMNFHWAFIQSLRSLILAYEKIFVETMEELMEEQAKKKGD